MAQAYPDAPEAGIVPAWLDLPGGVVGAQRVVRISSEGIRHIATRHRAWLMFCLLYLSEVLAKPEYLGQRPSADPNRVEFVRRVGARGTFLLVAVKFLDESNEAWVSTAHPIAETALTRRIRAGTMQRVGRGP